MTYLQWLDRYVELAIGDGDSTADTAGPGSPWLADTWRDRFARMLQRAEARLHPQDFGPIETLFAGSDGRRADCWRTLARPSPRSFERYPDAATVQLHPADVSVLRHAVQIGGQAGQLRAGHRQRRPPLVAQRLAVAGARRPVRRRPGVHHPRHRGGGRHHPPRRAGGRVAGPLRAGRCRRTYCAPELDRSRRPRAGAVAPT